jgi:ATP-dependent Clp protease ATP-binding subunit ClpA
VSLLDTACAKVAIGQAATPPAIEDARRTIDALTIEIDILKREQAAGAAHAATITELEAKKNETATTLAALEARFAEAFASVWRGALDNDGFNRLLLHFARTLATLQAPLQR